MITDTKYYNSISDKKIPLLKVVKSLNPNYYDMGNKKPYGFNRSLFSKKPEYDLTESYRIADTECFVSTTFNKKKSLILKEGYKLLSKNNEDVEYLNQRLNEIAYVTGFGLEDLLTELVTSILFNHNAFLYIARGENSSTGEFRPVDGSKQPIAGFFPLAEAKMSLIQSEFDEVLGYKYRASNRAINQFDADEIIHITVDKKPTSHLGTPPLEAVKDDIISLRQIEESLERLIYKLTVPLLHATVGTKEQPAGLDEDGRREIDVINEQLMYMDDAGGITTNHRVDIKMLGAESQALRLSEPLDYYKNRVLVGLVISDVDLGTGTTTTGGAASVVSESLQQNIEMYQRIIERAVTDQILTPLLLEKKGNEKKQYLLESEKVVFKFNNTNLDNKIKSESHLINEYNAKLITRDEYRTATGRDPLKEDEKDAIFTDLGVVKDTDKFAFEKKVQQDQVKLQKSAQGISTTNSSTNQPSQSSQPTSNYTSPTNQHNKSLIKDSIESVDTPLQKELKLRQYIDCLLLGKNQMAISLLTNSMSDQYNIDINDENNIKDNVTTYQYIEATVRSLTTSISTYIIPSIRDYTVLMDAVERFIIQRITSN